MKKMAALAMAAMMVLGSVPVQSFAENTEEEYFMEEAENMPSETEVSLQTPETEQITEQITETAEPQMVVPEIEEDQTSAPEAEEELIFEEFIEEETYGQYEAVPAELYASDDIPVLNGTENGFNYVLLGNGAGSYTVSITGYTGEKAGNLVIPDEIAGYKVTAIGSNAFARCSGFTGNLSLPSGLISIGDYAFFDCSGLTGELRIPESVTSIGNYAFNNCSNLTGGLKLPSGLTQIGWFAFWECSGLDGELKLPSSLEIIGSGAFMGCAGLTGELNLPDGLTVVGRCAFSGCSGFTGELNLPAGLTNIEEAAFEGCSGFDGNLTIPEGVTYIERGIFYNCTGFDGELTIPEGVEIIDEAAFYGCSGLTGKLVLPESVMRIESEAFWGCSGFDGDLVIPEGVERIAYSTFWNCSGFDGELVLPESVTSIEERAFWGCTGLSGDLVIPQGVSSIGDYAFYNCKGFTGDLELAEGLTTIGQIIFNNCSGLTGELIIPESVKEIDGHTLGGNFTRIENLSSALLILQEGFNWYDPDSVSLISKGYIQQGTAIKVGAFHIDSDMGTTARMLTGDTLQLTAVIDNLEEEPVYFSWGVSDDTVATIDEDGMLTAVGDGKAKITAYAFNELTASFSVTVEKRTIKISSLKMKSGTWSVKKGKTLQLNIQVVPSDATHKDVKWTSSNTKIATVNKNGLVKGKKYGRVVITAEALDGSGVTEECEITVGYGITYKLNGGKNNGKNPRVYYKSTVSLKNPTRKGYLFKGWYQDKKYKKKITKIKASSKKDLTLYAKWEKVKVAKPVIRSLKNTKGKKAALKFEKVSNASGYEILYGTSKNLRSASKITSKKVSVTLKNLDKGKIYYVKVRAYRTDSAGKKVYGQYSKTEDKKIEV